ncbi:hypothetical protein H2O64_06115 [Kordia sp. YSTF-M3]|uniref:Uncharacterized protein n=1 Tax=Kordia aestuariivivens TaxID=2759037 RepID=A0ABR7Q6Q1_9FLAO|nr:hypothetical protein [Kordia aestuariivivens]MBC8754239.1 hypothetical protein [Kordia aestuariivivens]
MKRIFKLFPFTVLALFLSVISCQHDDTLHQNDQKEAEVPKFIIKMENGDHLREINPTVYQQLSETSRYTSSLRNTEDETSTPSFTLDLSMVQIIERNTYTQYTTSIFDHADYETYLINYLLLDFDDGAHYQFLIKYPRIVTDQGTALDRSNAIMEAITGNTLLQPENIVGSPRPCLDSVPVILETVEQYSCTETPCTGGARHDWGEICPCANLAHCTMPTRTCGWNTVNVWGCSGGGTSGTGTTSPTGGGNDTTPNDSSDDEPIGTVPILSALEEIEMCMNMPSFVENIELSSAMISWLQTQPKDIVEVINNMLKEYSCNPQAQADIFDEIEGIIENPFIDTSLDHFAVDEITNNCLLGVVRDEIIINLNARIINTIRNTLGQQTNYILAFKNNDDLNSIANAGTSMPPQGAINNGSYPIVVNFANDYLSNNPTKLSLAATTIHEMVHALLIYLYFEGELLQKYPQFTDLKAKFDAYISNRNVVTETALEDSMHVSMVDLIGTMSYALFQYAKDNRMENVTHQYCKDITKGTFFGTPAMNIITPDINLQNDYILKAQNEQNNTSDAKGNDC